MKQYTELLAEGNIEIHKEHTKANKNDISETNIVLIGNVHNKYNDKEATAVDEVKIQLACVSVASLIFGNRHNDHYG